MFFLRILNKASQDDALENYYRLVVCLLGFLLVYLLLFASFGFAAGTPPSSPGSMIHQREVSRGHMISQVGVSCEWFGHFCIVVDKAPPLLCDHARWDAPFCRP